MMLERDGESDATGSQNGTGASTCKGGPVVIPYRILHIVFGDVAWQSANTCSTGGAYIYMYMLPSQTFIQVLFDRNEVPRLHYSGKPSNKRSICICYIL